MTPKLSLQTKTKQLSSTRHKTQETAMLPSDVENKKTHHGKTSRTKGHNGERELALLFKTETPFEKCTTTRNSSRILDNCKIDLNFIPLNVQSKVGEQKNMKPVSELKMMKDEMNARLPETEPQHHYPKIVVHKKPAKGKRTEFDTIVTMTLNDFMKLFKTAYPKK